MPASQPFGYPAVTTSKLSDLVNSGSFFVEDIEDRGEETIRLKRLGICENRRIDVLQTGDPMIVRVVGSRIGVSRSLARSIQVTSAETEVVPAMIIEENALAGMA